MPKNIGLARPIATVRERAFGGTTEGMVPVAPASKTAGSVFHCGGNFPVHLDTSEKAGHPEVLYGVADPAPVTVVEMTETIAQFREELTIICRRSRIYG